MKSEKKITIKLTEIELTVLKNVFGRNADVNYDLNITIYNVLREALADAKIKSQVEEIKSRKLVLEGAK